MLLALTCPPLPPCPPSTRCCSPPPPDLQIKEEIAKYKVGAPARVGLLAPNDVTIPGGGTGMDPSQTQFFQVLGIATKINKGTIEIVSDVHLIKAGDKVSRFFGGKRRVEGGRCMAGGVAHMLFLRNQVCMVCVLCL
jgi:hypothetical protein